LSFKHALQMTAPGACELLGWILGMDFEIDNGTRLGQKQVRSRQAP